MLRKSVSIIATIFATLILLGLQASSNAQTSGSGYDYGAGNAAVGYSTVTTGAYTNMLTGKYDTVNSFWFPYSVGSVSLAGSVDLSAYPTNTGVRIKGSYTSTASYSASTVYSTNSSCVTSAVVTFSGIPVKVGTTSATLSGSFTVPDITQPGTNLKATFVYKIGSVSTTLASNTPYIGSISLP